MLNKLFHTLVFLFVFTASSLAQNDTIYTQSYMDKSTRFAWLTYGGDINYLTGGTTQQLINVEKQNSNFGTTILPRLTIGGIHFWGHADFYVSFPLSFLSLQDIPDGLDELEVYQGVETGARIFPYKLQPKRISPFVGISFRRIRFSQESENSGSNNGTPGFGQIVYPMQFGLTYTTNKWHISASAYYNFQNEFNYYISPTEQAAVKLDPISFNLSLLKYIDTDRYLRTKNAVNRINKNYQNLKNANRLSSWFIGIGPSGTLQTSKSSYLKENFAFFHDQYTAAILPDISFGRYFHNIDANANLSYRTYGDKYQGFNNKITTRRHSVGLESVKYLANYHGFVPFVGPIVSYESLSVNVNKTMYQENKMAVGITFGWDIRVTKTATSLLRTNLRYYPNLHLEIDGEKMMFDHLEFNFIQWVQYLGRKKVLRN